MSTTTTPVGIAAPPDLSAPDLVDGGFETTVPEPVRPLRPSSWTAWALRLGSLTAALALWQLLTTGDVDVWLRFSKIPAPTEVVGEAARQLASGQFYRDIAASLQRILAGFGLAAVSGVAIGALTGRSRVACHLVRPVLEVLRPIPGIAWVPLAILLFPTSEQGIVFITFIAAFFPIMVSTHHAVRALPVVWEDGARTIGAGPRTVLSRVVLPGALPGIFSGFSVGIGVAWICVVSAEMISGQYGIGYYTWKSYGLIDYPGVLVGMVSIGLLGWASAVLVELAGRRATRWLPRNDTSR